MTLELRQSTLFFILIALLAVLIFGKPTSQPAVQKTPYRHTPVDKRNARPTVDLTAMDQKVVDSFNNARKEFHSARAK